MVVAQSAWVHGGDVVSGRMLELVSLLVGIAIVLELGGCECHGSDDVGMGVVTFIVLE